MAQQENEELYNKKYYWSESEHTDWDPTQNPCC